MELTITDADGDTLVVRPLTGYDEDTVEVTINYRETVWLTPEQALLLGRALVRMAAA